MAFDFYASLAQYQAILAAIAISSTLILGFLGFLWRTMKKNIKDDIIAEVNPKFNDVNTKIDDKTTALNTKISEATNEVKEQLNQQDKGQLLLQKTIEAVEKGQSAIGENVTKVQECLTSSSNILNKHVLESTADRSSMRAIIEQHEKRLGERIMSRMPRRRKKSK